ncbi:MAG: urease accessory protein UreF [Cyanobacteria bacterium P01_D01_bin.123]
MSTEILCHSDADAIPLLRLLQLASPTLPVGAYSYSEGLETLVETKVVANESQLQHWLEWELAWGSTPIDAAMVTRAYRAVEQGNCERLRDWNMWWSAARETAELRAQSWQMGRSLARLLQELDPITKTWLEAVGLPCNFAIAYGLAAACWRVDLPSALLAYLQSWASNAIGAGVKLIPLGQTAGQRLLFQLDTHIATTVARVIELDDADLSSCSWGVAMASSQHETQTVRLFQS